MTAQDVIDKLNLIPLPEEGGFYRETFRSPGLIPAEALPKHGGARSFSTQIYYLVTPEEFSGLHRVKASEEVFHFYMGDPVEMVQFDANGECEAWILGNDLLKDQVPQLVVPAGVWQGTRLVEGGRWALLGCSVAPGFDFADFEIKNREEFHQMFPGSPDAVERYTRP